MTRHAALLASLVRHAVASGSSRTSSDDRGRTQRRGGEGSAAAGEGGRRAPLRQKPRVSHPAPGHLTANPSGVGSAWVGAGQARNDARRNTGLCFRRGAVVAVAALALCCGDGGAGSGTPTGGEPGAGGQGAEPSPCGANQTQCGDSCVDLDSSNAHCGSCDTACMPGETCVAGICTSSGTAGSSTGSGATGGDTGDGGSGTGGASAVGGGTAGSSTGSGATTAGDTGGGSGDTGGGGDTSGGGATGGGGDTGGGDTGGGGTGGEGAAAGSAGSLSHTGEVPAFQVGDGQLTLQVCAQDIIRVAYATDSTFVSRSTLATAPKRCDATTPWELTETETEATLRTAKLQARVDLATGAVTFLDLAARPILAERARVLTPAQVQAEQTQHVQQQWEPNEDEALYGLGQHQQNLMDIKHFPLSLIQYNTEIVVPFFVSSRGYGVLWDNTSYTRWGNLTDFVSINGNGGDYQGQFRADVSGDYIFQTYSSGAIELQVDGQVVIEHWRQGWLPGIDYARVPMQAGQTYSLRLDHTPDISVNIADLSYQPPAADPVTSLWSNVGEGIDYYFVYGPEIDRVIAAYRQLTGEAPMMPKWAYGLWQSREKYDDAAQLLGVLEEFRNRNIPVDNIVQDWQYWRPGTWGSHEFDSSRFPDPQGFIQQIHEQYHARLLLSLWPKFHTGTANFDELNAAGFIYQPNLQEGIEDFNGYAMTYYDAFDADARAMYWSQINQDLFSLGVDAWWMDGTEPEIVEGPYSSPAEQRELYETHMHPTALGSGARMLNAYSLVNSQAVYEGQRRAAPNQRVFILTRSAFAGQQRYAAASWSGDITTTWTAFRKQIPAGLGFTISGIPYWTMDVGGFAEHPDLRGDSAEWGELSSRWFQYGTFTPLLRVHGQDDRVGPREMYNLDSQAFQAQLKFDRLRYRLLPYVYSLAGAVTHEGSTIMRPLVMDFRTDSAAQQIDDQYMFGPAFLVSPVTTYQARQRQVYLPVTPGGWYDFWTGAAEAGGQTIMAEAPYDSLPLFLRAGSIVPIGPELQYTDEAPPDPITLYVYAGADGTFTLYEDDGLNYDYEDGAFTRIVLTWNQAARTLTIGARQGSFAGMLANRTFEVILIEPTQPVGFSFTPEVEQSVVYDGTAVTLEL
jgi:alpha-D-xyloside xylohydrolase